MCPDLSKVLLVENSLASCLFQPCNSIICSSYEVQDTKAHHDKDRELLICCR